MEKPESYLHMGVLEPRRISARVPAREIGQAQTDIISLSPVLDSVLMRNPWRMYIVNCGCWQLINGPSYQWSKNSYCSFITSLTECGGLYPAIYCQKILDAGIKMSSIPITCHNTLKQKFGYSVDLCQLRIQSLTCFFRVIYVDAIVLLFSL